MIEWLYMLASLLLFGSANFLRKISSTGVAPSESPFWEGVGYIPVAVGVLLFFPLPATPELLLLSAGAGFAAAIAVSMMYKALREGYVSAVTAITNLNTHLAAFLAILIFAEPAPLRVVAGILLAAAVVVLITKSKSVKPGKWMLFALASLVFFALNNLLNKTLTGAYAPLFAFAFVSLFTTVGYAPAFLLGKRASRWPARLRLAGVGLVIAVAFAFLFLAFSLAPLSLVAPVVGMNLLVTALLGAFFLKERLDSRAWMAIALALVSIWLLAG